MKWITKTGLSLEKMISIWLIKRFIDAEASLIFCDENNMDEQMASTMAIPFEIEGTEFTSTKNRTAFEQFLISYKLNNPALKKMEKALRGCNQEGLKKLLQESGNQKVTIIENSADDNQRLEKAMLIFDTIYDYFKTQQGTPNFFEPKIIKSGGLG